MIFPPAAKRRMARRVKNAVNFTLVRALANLVAATTVTGALDGSGRWCLKPNAAMDIVIDVSGWYGVGA